MRDIFKRTRQLPLAEWKEYWAMEAINDRGIGIDLEMVEAAAAAGRAGQGTLQARNCRG